MQAFNKTKLSLCVETIISCTISYQTNAPVLDMDCNGLQRHVSILKKSCYFLTVIFTIAAANLQFDKDLISIMYSPYASNYNRSRLPPVPNMSKDEYTLNDIKIQLNIISSKFSSVITFGMGVTDGNSNKRWNQTYSESLISTAAAELNKISGQRQISVLQGIKMGQYEKNELENAIQSTIYANSIFPNTVWGLLFHTSLESDNSQLKEILTVYQSSASYFEKLKMIKIGIRFSKNQCEEVLKIQNQDRLIENIIKSVDFIICSSLHNIFDSSHTMAEKVIAEFEKLIKEFKKSFTNIQFYFECGWSTMGLSNNNLDVSEKEKREVSNLVEYWSVLQKWSSQTKNRVIYFEAFDEPWKCQDPYRDPTPECQYGLWFLNKTDKNGFVFKADLFRIRNLDQSSEFGHIRYIVLGIIVFVSIISVLIMIICCYQIKKKKKKILSETEVQTFLYGLNLQLNENVPKDLKACNCEETDYAFVLPYDQSLELPKEKFTVEMGCILGSGAFGMVYKGTIHEIPGPVAFKTVRTGRSEELKDILAEIKIMSYIGKHPNIIGLLGAYTKEIRNGIAFIGMEYCSKGSLQNYLRKHSKTSDSSPSDYANATLMAPYANSIHTPGARYTYDPTCYYFSFQSTTLETTDEDNFITLDNMIKWCYQISNAMEYLEAKKVIHGDLATRNVLLTSDFDAKVTDFGLSRRLYTYTEYVKTGQEPLPWRWMSLESLKQMNFSSKSDVWSYGVTIWEIFTLGDIPYPGLNWSPDFTNLLEEGLRLLQPKRADESIYEVMFRSWNADSQERPSFHEITEFFQNLNIYSVNK